VARGAIGNPWIFQQVRALAAGHALPAPPTLHEQADVLRRHFALAEQLYGERCGRIMRKFGAKYAASHPQFEQVREAFVRIRTAVDWQAVLVHWYRDDLPGRYPPRETHHVR